MGKALYRTYRSKSFDEVIGQQHVTTTLQNALKSNTINHAYLLTGPKGVGKTSVARILAHEVNGLSYQHDVDHVDIIEIDAASNRRIDEIRELRESARTVPTSLKYKVYIIDEVHMLTREAFNALLKTLEEPPAHVIFILATTEFHKLPDTIVSRCLRFNFKPIEVPDITAQLRHIADTEKLQIDDAALELLAQHGDGSFRDSISALDQIRSIGGSVSLQDVERMVGIAPQATILSVWDSLSSGQAQQLLDRLADIYELGVSPSELAKQLGVHARSQLVQGTTDLPSQTVLELLKNLLDILGSGRPKAQLELTLLSVLLTQAPQQSSQAKQNLGLVKSQEKIAEKPKPKTETPQNQDTQTTKPPEEPVQNKTPTNDELANDDPWTQVLGSLKAKNNTLYSIARMAQTSFGDATLTLSFNFAFHHKQVSEEKNKQLIMDVVRAQQPQITSLDVVFTPGNSSSAAKQPTDESRPDPIVSSISNIFGPSEVLES